MNAAVTTIALGAAFLSLSGQSQTKDIAAAQPDAHRLQTGQFTYKDSNNGKELGSSKITIEKEVVTGNYDFSNESKGAFAQQWVATATPSFTPLSASLSFGTGSNSSPYFDLTYSPGKVTGYLVSRTQSELGHKQPVESVISPDTVDQRIDWATVLASDLQPGRQFQFSVYDPGIGTSHVIASVGPLEQVHVPAGSFQIFRITYRVSKATGAEQYVVFATQSLPRVMIREDFPDGTTSELVETAK
jgi:hypothetical protein